MGYLPDAEVAALLPQARSQPEVEAAVRDFEAAWANEGLPPREIDATFVGAVFLEEPPAPLLSEDRRRRAADAALWQLVFQNGVVLDVRTFDDAAAAEAALQALKPDEFGEGGGLVLRGGEVVAEKLYLKYMQKQDYLDYFQRAIEPAKEVIMSDNAKLTAVESALQEQLARLTKLAPKIGALKREYEAKHLAEPEVVYGRPTEALNEFAQIYPGLVKLGGCMPPH